VGASADAGTTGNRSIAEAEPPATDSKFERQVEALLTDLNDCFWGA
jgi:hypothetical protein